MSRLRTAFSSSITQIFFLFLFSAILYFALSRTGNDINDFVLSGDLAYLANGSGGLRIFSISKPDQLTEINYFRCTSPFLDLANQKLEFRKCATSANALWLQNDHLFLTNGRNGLWMFDISEDPNSPSLIDRINLPGNSQDVVVLDDYAYVAAGNQGIRIVQINPTGSSSNNQQAQKYQLEDLNYQPLASAGDALKIFTDQQFLYWTDNKKNLQIWGTKKKTQPNQVSNTSYDFDIDDITFLGKYALIAAGDAGLVILNKADPAEPKLLYTLNLNGSAKSIYVIGNYAYVSVEGIGIVIVDITYMTSPRIVKQPYIIGGKPDKIIVNGDQAYLSNNTYGFSSYEIGVIINSKKVGESGTPVIVNGVVKSGNYAYLAAGERGLRVLDVTNPTNPADVAFLDTAGQAQAVAVSGDTAYVADRNNGLVVVDITNKNGELHLLKTLSGEDVRDVAIQGTYAYLADYDTGLSIVDITHPITATLVKTMDIPDGLVIHPQAVSVSGEYAYLSDGDQGFSVVNIFDKNIPTLIQQVSLSGGMDVRNVAVINYNHQIAQISGQDPYNPDPNDPNTKTYAYVANGSKGLRVLDVTNPEQQIPVQINLDSSISTLPGIAMDVAIFRDRAYLAYDGIGVYILDTTDPANPKLVGLLNTQEAGNRAVGLYSEGSIVYLAASEYGLVIIDASNTANPVIVGQYNAPDTVFNLAVQGNFIYTADGQNGLWIFNISNPKLPQEINFVSIPHARAVFVSGTTAYVAAGNNGLQIVNISDKQNAFVEGILDTDGQAQSVLVVKKVVSGSENLYAFIADGTNGLVVANVTNPTAPAKVGALSGFGEATRLTYDGSDYLYISANLDGLAAVNVVDPSHPALMSSVKATDVTRAMEIIPPIYGYVAAGDAGMPILDISYPLAMKSLRIDDVGGGNWIENLSTPLTDPVTGTITATLSVPPYYTFLADRDFGVLTLETADPVNPLRRGEWDASKAATAGQSYTDLDINQVLSYWIPPAQDNDEPGMFRLYVADTLHGFSILDAVKVATITGLDTYEMGRLSLLTALRSFIRSKLSGDPYPSIRTSLFLSQTLLDIVFIGGVGFFLWLAFIALFIVPIDRFTDWENLYGRLVFYLFNRHGAVSRVTGGKLVSSVEERTRSGPGLLTIDVGSAVVLEKRNLRGRSSGAVPLARVAGSGIVYTGNRPFLSRLRYDEILRGIADLRPQVRFSSGVNAYTRDGIEIETTVFSLFTLGEEPDILRVTYIPPGSADPENVDQAYLPYHPQADDLRVVLIRRSSNGNWEIERIADELDADDKKEIHQQLLNNPPLHVLNEFENVQMHQSGQNHTPFVVNPVRIFEAIFAQAEDLPENKQLDWTELPTLVTIERFRNLLAGEVYDNLYDPLNATNLPISRIKADLTRWVRNQGVLSYQYVRRLDKSPLQQGQVLHTGDLLCADTQALGNPKILRSRGIKVNFAGFSELTPTSEEVRKQYLDYWQAQRERDINITLSNFQLQASRQENEWRIQAQQEILDEFINILDSNPDADAALAMHVLQALESAASDPDTSPLLPSDTIEMLRNVRNWLLRP